MQIQTVVAPAINASPGKSRAVLMTWIALWCVLVASVGFCWNLYSVAASDDQDGINYECAAHSMMDNASYMKWRYPYASMTQSGSLFNGYFPYPNYAYIFTVGVLGKIRGVWDVSNGMIVSFIFQILSTMAAAAIMYRLSRDVLLTLLFALAMQSIPIIRNVSILPMAEMCLAFFFYLSILRAIDGKLFTAGALLGIGYLFRGQGLMFLPYILWIALGYRKPMGYIKPGIILGLGFVPAFILNWGMKYLLSKGLPANDFYADMSNKVFLAFLNPENLVKIPRFFVSVINEHSYLFVPILIMMINPGRLSVTTRRFALVSVINIVLMVVLWIWFPMLPFRYFIYFMPLLLISLYVDFTSAKYRQLSAFCLTLFILLFPLQTFCDLVKVKPSDQVAYAKKQIFHYQDADRSIFTKDVQAIATTDFALVSLYSSSAAPVTLPEYEKFLAGKANSRIDVIMVSARQEHDAAFTSWMEAPAVVKDAQGTVFNLVPTPTPNLLKVYLRGDRYREYQSRHPELPSIAAMEKDTVQDKAGLNVKAVTDTAQVAQNPDFTEGWQTLSSYDGGRIKIQTERGKSIKINLAEENPRQGDFVGIKRTVTTTPGKEYELKAIIEDDYKNNYPGRLAEQVRVNGQVVWTHDIGEGTFSGNQLISKKFTADKTATEISIELRAVGPIDPWHWGLQSLRVLGYDLQQQN